MAEKMQPNITYSPTDTSEAAEKWREAARDAYMKSDAGLIAKAVGMADHPFDDGTDEPHVLTLEPKKSNLMQDVRSLLRTVLGVDKK